MIAVNIMSIEVTALAFDDNIARVGEVFFESGAGEMPVLKADNVLAGVLSKASLPRYLKEAAKAGKGSLTAGCLCKRAFRSAAPGAAFFELKEMLKGADERPAYVYIVDNAGRLLGRVGKEDLARRAAEYGEKSWHETHLGYTCISHFAAVNAFTAPLTPLPLKIFRQKSG